MEAIFSYKRSPCPHYGNIREYPCFKNDFQKFVLPRIGDGSAASYILASCLKGEPHNIIKSISDDANAMWNRLDEVYGDPSKVVDAVMQELKRMEPVQEDDHRALLFLIDNIEWAYADLHRLNMEKEICNSHAVSLIEEKLPRDVKMDWSKKLNKSRNEGILCNKFPHLLEFLKEHRRIIEYADSSIRQLVNEESGAVSYAGDEKGKKVGSCLIHNVDSHSTKSCRLYDKMAAKERVELMNSKKACFSCLETNHFMKNCPNTAKCGIDECQKAHHSSLHEAHKQGAIFHGTANSSVLLQIMKIYSTSQKPGNVTVMWDSAAEFCLITFDKAKQLRLKGRPIYLTITKVGGDSEKNNSYVYQVPLRDRSGITHYFEAYGVKKISSKVNKIDTGKVLHLFPGVKAEDIERPSGNIDFLIGFNYAPLHPVNVMNPEGNLVLLENNFGRCLGGSHRALCEETINHVRNVAVNFVSGSSRIIESFVDTFVKGENMGVSCWPKCGDVNAENAHWEP